jgi:hypothetical protein
MDVRLWLGSLHLQQYTDVIVASGFESMETAQTLTEDSLITLGVTQENHRQRMLASLADMHMAATQHLRERLYTGEDFGLNRVLNRVDSLRTGISSVEATIQESDEQLPSFESQFSGDAELDSMMASLCDFGTQSDEVSALAFNTPLPTAKTPAPNAAATTAAASTATTSANPFAGRKANAADTSPLKRSSGSLRGSMRTPARAAPAPPPGAETKFGRSRSMRTFGKGEQPQPLACSLSVRDNKTPQEINERLDHLRKEISSDSNAAINSAQLDAMMADEKVRIAMEKLAEARVQKDTIKFYFESQTSKTLVVESVDTAQLICTKLAQKHGLIDQPNLQIVEHCPSLHIERHLEDHESVTDAYRMWPPSPSCDYMLLLRRNPLKYDLFINPARYFARLLKDDLKDTPTERAEKAKKLLMQEYFKTTVKTPELSGYLQERTGTRKWRRRFFLLRSSSLYFSTKSESKESKDLDVYVRFDECDICTTFDYIKYSKSPTEFCIAFKPRMRKKEVSVDDMRAVCFVSEEELDSWLAGMRLAKFGSNLKDNYETTLRQVDRLVEIGAASAEMQHEIQSSEPSSVTQTKNSKLVREWKTVRSKVHPGVSAATGVEFGSSEDDEEEDSEQAAERLRQQQLQRLQQQRQQQQQKKQEEEQQQQHQSASYEDTPPRQMTAQELADSLAPLPYFHGRISRETAERYFMERHNEPGLFLLRESQSSPGSYVLSVVKPGSKPYHHFQIHTTPTGF